MVKPIENEEYRGTVPPSANADARLCAQDLAGALHEVSNALTVVLGWLEVAQQHVTGDRAVEAVNIALRQARFGHRVARRAIGAGALREKGTQSLDELVSESMLAVRPLAERRGVDVCATGLPLADVWLPNCDSAEQILINLLLNAIAFSPEGRTVTLTCRASQQRVTIEVCDEGPGIDEVRAKNLWDSPVSTRRGGAGVGLSYCRNLAREQDGDLRFVAGTTGAAFELDWPRTHSVDDAPSAPPVARCLGGLQILLVEDDPSICSLVELTFECQGSRVVSAGTLADIRRAKLREGHFDLALVDLSPFGQDIKGGLDVLRQGAGQMPLVLITGSAAGLPDGEEASFVAWVRKPFEAGELIATVKRIAGR